MDHLRNRHRNAARLIFSRSGRNLSLIEKSIKKVAFRTAMQGARAQKGGMSVLVHYREQPWENIRGASALSA